MVHFSYNIDTYHLMTKKILQNIKVLPRLLSVWMSRF